MTSFKSFYFSLLIFLYNYHKSDRAAAILTGVERWQKKNKEGQVVTRGTDVAPFQILADVQKGCWSIKVIVVEDKNREEMKKIAKKMVKFETASSARDGKESFSGSNNFHKHLELIAWEWLTRTFQARKGECVAT